MLHLFDSPIAWCSESSEAPPERLVDVDDRTRAADALRQIQGGAALQWRGDYHNGLQLLRALQRRIERRGPAPSGTLAERWAARRAQRGALAAQLGAVIVVIEADGRLELPRAPDTREAVRWAWPERSGERFGVALRTLTGALAAAGWRREGVAIPGLSGKIHPHYGVFSPTRHAYLRLLDELGGFRGKTVLDVGCGTGVLSFSLIERGAGRAIGIDIEPRAVVCALDNAARLGHADRFQARQADLMPPEQCADLVIFNPPWLPEAPRTRLDRAVFDAGGRTVARFLHAVPAHLNPGGRVALIVSDLAERLELRAPDALPTAFDRAGLTVLHRATRAAGHPRSRRTDDPLHQARAAEQVQLWVLQPDAK